MSKPERIEMNSLTVQYPSDSMFVCGPVALSPAALTGFMVARRTDHVSEWADFIGVSASREDEEPGRLHRLRQLLGLAWERANDKRHLSALVHVHDHKGNLTCVWLVRSLRGEAAMADAWSAFESEQVAHGYLTHED